MAFHSTYSALQYVDHTIYVEWEFINGLVIHVERPMCHFRSEDGLLPTDKDHLPMSS